MRLVFPFFFSFLLLLPLCNQAQSPAQHVNEVSFRGNGYVYADKDARLWRMVSDSGLRNWNNPAVYTRVFFYPGREGKIDVSVKMRSGNDAALSIQLDGKGKSVSLKANKSDNFVIVPAGSFEIKGAHYHFIELKGISKAGNNFPDIQSLIFSGPAAEDLKYNLSGYRGAASTHLWYEYPKDSTIAWFYNEVTVPQGVDATNAYYMTNGFSGGYSGIQLNSTTERRFIFSVWSSYNTNDPKEIPKDYAVTLLKKGKNVIADDFGNEGSGGHSHLVFPWKQGVTYKVLIGAKPDGDHTIYSCYYFAPENGKWELMAVWDKTKTGGKLFSGLYSFVENFGGNGNDFFKAEYGNQWVCTPSGTWIELTKCFLTTTASPQKHQRYDYGAGVENNKFYMFTGGFKEMNNLAPRSVIERKPNGIVPDIDFSALPVE